MLGILTEAPGWLLLAALVFAPWAYGCTRPGTIAVLNIILAAALGLWLLGCVISRTWPRLPIVLCGSMVLLFLQGWWMTWNAQFDFLPERWTFTPHPAPVAWAPGAIDQSESMGAAVRVTVLLGTAALVCHLARRKSWRRRLFWIMAANGAALALFGLAQRLGSAPAIFWQAADTGKTFFATYRYHSNAGAFLNLVWPLAAAWFVAAWHKPQPSWARLGWGAAMVAGLTGLAVCGSRAAGLLGLFSLGAGCFWFARRARREQCHTLHLPSVIVASALSLFLILAVAATVGLDVSLRRWQKLDEIFSAQNPRLLVAGVCLSMIPEAGWFGFGPGTFEMAFPYYTNHLGNAISGIWRYAHQDYLQTLIEWGYVGGVAWGAFVFGGLIAFWGRRRSGRHTSRTERALSFGMVLAIATTLAHALVDFPLQIASIQLNFVVLLGILWSHPAGSCPGERESLRRRAGP